MVVLRHHYWIYKKRFTKTYKSNKEPWVGTYWALMKTRNGKSNQHEFVKLLGNVQTVDRTEAIARAYERCPELAEGPQGIPIEVEVEFHEQALNCPRADEGRGDCKRWDRQQEKCRWQNEKVSPDDTRECIRWKWDKQGYD